MVRVRAQVMRRDESVVGWVPLEGGGLSVLGIRKLDLEPRESRPAALTLAPAPAPALARAPAPGVSGPGVVQQPTLPGLPGLPAQTGLSGQLGQVGIEIASRAEPEATITPAAETGIASASHGELFVMEGRRISDNQLVLYCTISGEMKYFLPNPTFHYWLTPFSTVIPPFGERMLLAITGQELRCGLSFQSAAEAEIFASAVKAAIAASGSNGATMPHLQTVGEPECGAQQRLGSAAASTWRGTGGRYTQRGRTASGAIVATCAVCTGSIAAYTVRKSFVGDTSDLDTSQGALSTAISNRRRPAGLGAGGTAPPAVGRDEESTTSDLGVQLSSSVCSSQTDPTHTLSPSSVPLVVTAAEQSERPIELEAESPIGERRDSKFLMALSRQGRLLHTASESNILQAKVVAPDRLPRMAAFSFQRATPSTRERHPLQLAIGSGLAGSITPRSLSTSATYYSLAASGPQSSSPPHRRQGSQGERRWTFHISHLFHHQTHHSQRPGSASSGGGATSASAAAARVAFSGGGGGAGQHREPSIAITSAIAPTGRRTGSTPYMPPSTRGSQRSTGSARSSRVEQAQERPLSYRRRRCIYCGTNFVNDARFNRVGSCTKAPDRSARVIDNVTCLACVSSLYRRVLQARAHARARAAAAPHVGEGGSGGNGAGGGGGRAAAAAAASMDEFVDNESMCACEEPLCARPTLLRWAFVGVCALVLPCLWCYWPLRGARRTLMCCHVCGPRHQAALYV